MTIRDMQVFCMVADCGKMIDASKKLYIAPASVSQTIAELETEFGVKLFERLNKKLYITDAGAKLLSYSRHILNLYEDMELSMKIGVSSLSVRIGATPSIATCLMPNIIHRCQRKCPQVDFRVYEQNIQKIETQLLGSELDVGIIAGSICHKDIISKTISKNDMVLICGKKNSFYGRETVATEELQNQPFILQETGSIERDLFEELKKRYELTINEKWVCSNPMSIGRAVAANHGIALVPRMLAEREYKQEDIHCFDIEGEPLVFEVCLVYHKNKYIFQALQCFLMACQNRC